MQAEIDTYNSAVRVFSTNPDWRWSESHLPSLVSLPGEQVGNDNAGKSLSLQQASEQIITLRYDVIDLSNRVSEEEVSTATQFKTAIDCACNVGKKADIDVLAVSYALLLFLLSQQGSSEPLKSSIECLVAHIRLLEFGQFVEDECERMKTSTDESIEQIEARNAKRMEYLKGAKYRSLAASFTEARSKVQQFVSEAIKNHHGS